MSELGGAPGVLRRSALVTGGVSGLGRAVAELLLGRGFAVTVTHRTSHEKARAFEAAARERGQVLLALAADAADEGAVRASLARHRESFGEPWALVHAAGPFLAPRTPFTDVSLERLRSVLDGNLWSAMLYAREVLAGMRAAGGGRLVFFGFDEAAALPGWPGRAAYAAAKSGVASLARSLAEEEAPHGITVNVVCPGDIRRPLKEAGIAEARRLAGAEGAAPIGRPGSGEDVARVVGFLLEPDSDFLTGNLIAVDGGLDVIRRRR